MSGEGPPEIEEPPPPATLSGYVSSVEELTRDVLEVVLAFEKRVRYLPGQAITATFRGFPARDYCPTLRLDGWADLNELVLHVRRGFNGAVSSALGSSIWPGHPVRIRGPFGSAYHRRDAGRLVLVSSGVGFAPVWAIARASRLREPDRPLVVVAGAGRPGHMYMGWSLDWLRGRGAEVRSTCSSIDQDGGGILAGRPTRHLPLLTTSDTVMACGAPGMVSAVELLAASAGAACHATPFLPAQTSARFRDQLLRPFLARHAVLPGSIP